MNVVGAGCSFHNFHILLLGKFAENLTSSLANLFIEDFLSVFGNNDDVVGAIPRNMRLLFEGRSRHTKNWKLLTEAPLMIIVLERRNGRT